MFLSFSGKKDMVTSVLQAGSSPYFFTWTNIAQQTNSAHEMRGKGNFFFSHLQLSPDDLVMSPPATRNRLLLPNRLRTDYWLHSSKRDSWITLGLTMAVTDVS